MQMLVELTSNQEAQDDGSELSEAEFELKHRLQQASSNRCGGANPQLHVVTAKLRSSGACLQFILLSSSARPTHGLIHSATVFSLPDQSLFSGAKN